MRRNLVACVLLLGGCASWQPDYTQMSTEELEDIVAEPEPSCSRRPYACPDPPQYPDPKSAGTESYSLCMSWQSCAIDHGGWWRRTHDAADELDRRAKQGEEDRDPPVSSAERVPGFLRGDGALWLQDSYSPDALIVQRSSIKDDTGPSFRYPKKQGPPFFPVRPLSAAGGAAWRARC